MDSGTFVDVLGMGSGLMVVGWVVRFAFRLLWRL